MLTQKNSRGIGQLAALVLMFALIGKPAVACDMHFGAFGFNPHAARGQLAQQLQSPFTLRQPTMQAAEPLQEAEFVLRFTRPEDALDVQLSIESSDGVEVLSHPQSITLEQTRGQQSVRFKASQPGFHSLVVTISGAYAGKVHRVSERVYINARFKNADI